MITIGIQGGKGSFSEEAALQFADNHGLEKIEIAGCSQKFYIF